MKTLTALFFSTKYWTNADELLTAATEIAAKFPNDRIAVFTDSVLPDPDAYADCDTLLIVPCSGSVQPHIREMSRRFSSVILFAGYVQGNFSAALCDRMLCANAAPTLMDCFGVLRRDADKTVLLCKNFAELARTRRLLAARNRIRNGRILMIGAPEPWVISVSRDYAVYREQWGITVETVSQKELIARFEAVTDEEAEEIFRYFRDDAREIAEPTEHTLRRCARMAEAMRRLISEREADGLAIACFDLIGRLGVNPCLGVSYLNGETPYFAACEGDIDSAVTMLMVRALTDEHPFMANPCLQADDTVNFAHCTAPLRVHGEKRPFLLRDHHETKLGASPRVFYGEGQRVTMLRCSGAENAVSIHTGMSVPGRYEPNCRTQLCIRPDDYRRWTETVLGCHQVLTFCDIADDAAALCRLLGIRVL